MLGPQNPRWRTKSTGLAELWASVACVFLLYYPRRISRGIVICTIRNVSRRVRAPHASYTIGRATGPVVVVDMVSHRTIRWEKDLSVFEYNPRRRSVYPLCCRTAFAIFHGGELLPA